MANHSSLVKNFPVLFLLSLRVFMFNSFLSQLVAPSRATLPATNIAPENGYIVFFWDGLFFQGQCYFQGVYRCLARYIHHAKASNHRCMVKHDLVQPFTEGERNSINVGWPRIVWTKGWLFNLPKTNMAPEQKDINKYYPQRKGSVHVSFVNCYFSFWGKVPAL